MPTSYETTGSQYYYASTAQAWDGWQTTSNTTSATQTICIPNQMTWNHWVMDGTSVADTVVTTADVTLGPGKVIWYRWNGTAADYTIARDTTIAMRDQYVGNWSSWVDKQEESHAQKMDRRIREEEQKAAAEARLVQAVIEEKNRVAADARAKSLLMAALTKPQLKRFLRDECIPVDTEAGNKYLIKKGRSANINVFNPDGTIKHRLCAHPVAAVPDYDTMLSQLLYLRYQESEFLGLANVHRA
jgi:hypothetical protein